LDLGELVERHGRKLRAIDQLEPKLFQLDLRGSGAPTLLVRIKGSKGHGFTPELSHYVKSSSAAGPHRPSFHASDTLDEALDEAVLHGLMFYDPDDEGATWEANPLFR